MSLCATAKVFASPRTVFTQMDAVATILLGLETYGVCSWAVSVNTYVCISLHIVLKCDECEISEPSGRSVPLALSASTPFTRQCGLHLWGRS